MTEDNPINPSVRVEARASRATALGRVERRVLAMLAGKGRAARGSAPTARKSAVLLTRPPLL